ncbi:MAG: IgA Peptidase M64 [Candidatus Aminicenantes bacterium]|nr:IgA Peptidase M64 [Candidatus Aminicenantes bacterium]
MSRGLHLVLAFVALPGVLLAQAPVPFADHFVDRTMRVDYYHAGNAEEESVTVDRIYDQGLWAGSRTVLVDPFNFGRYRIVVADAATGTTLFSKGFDSYFGEYKTSEPALRGVRRTYHESALLPFPKKKVKFTIERRDRQNRFQPFFSQEVDPADPTISRERPAADVRVFDLRRSGDPHVKVDLAFVAEGYTAAEEAKLRADLDRFVGILSKLEPYRSHLDAFNLYGVWRPSAESGCDEPSYGIYKTTAVGATFDSLGSERYVLTEDNRALRDIAARVPYDALVIMINHKRYGGGGIYNAFCTFTTDNQWHEYLFLHEFGHSFAGLGDEYYSSEVAYNDFYPRGVEPAEPNLTALLDPQALKWRNLVTAGTPVPTPWEKAAYDKMDEAYQKVRREMNARIAKLKREGASLAEVTKAEEESERLSRENGRKVDAFLGASKFRGQVGAFEGAGYSSAGLFRPAVDCLMFTRGTKPLCRVCEAAVLKMIQAYSR